MLSTFFLFSPIRSHHPFFPLLCRSQYVSFFISLIPASFIPLWLLSNLCVTLICSLNHNGISYFFLFFSSISIPLLLLLLFLCSLYHCVDVHRFHFRMENLLWTLWISTNKMHMLAVSANCCSWSWGVWLFMYGYAKLDIRKKSRNRCAKPRIKRIKKGRRCLAERERERAYVCGLLCE